MNRNRINEFVHSRRFPLLSALILCTGLIFLIVGIVLTIIGSVRTANAATSKGDILRQCSKEHVDLYSMKADLNPDFKWNPAYNDIKNPTTVKFMNEIEPQLQDLIRRAGSYGKSRFLQLAQQNQGNYDVMKVQILKFEPSQQGIRVYASAVLLGDKIPKEADLNVSIKQVPNNNITNGQTTEFQSSSMNCQEMECPSTSTTPAPTPTSCLTAPTCPPMKCTECTTPAPLTTCRTITCPECTTPSAITTCPPSVVCPNTPTPTTCPVVPTTTRPTTCPACPNCTTPVPPTSCTIVTCPTSSFSPTALSCPPCPTASSTTAPKTCPACPTCSSTTCPIVTCPTASTIVSSSTSSSTTVSSTISFSPAHPTCPPPPSCPTVTTPLPEPSLKPSTCPPCKCSSSAATSSTTPLSTTTSSSSSSSASTTAGTSTQSSTISSVQTSSTHNFTTSSSTVSISSLSTTSSSQPPSTSTTPPRTTITSTAPLTTPPSYCKGGDGPFVRQDISVVYELSTDSATIDKKIADFIGNTLFTPASYKLPGYDRSGDLTQILLAPYPNTTSYGQLEISNYQRITTFDNLTALLNGTRQLNAIYKIHGNAIVDGINFVEGSKITGNRPDVKKTMIIIATGDTGVAAATAAAEKWKSSATAITIAAGNGAKNLGLLATKGFEYQVSSLDDVAETLSVASKITTRLLVQSGACPSHPTTTQTTTTTAAPTTSTTAQSTLTLTSTQPTPPTCSGGGPFIRQDLMVIYELSTDKNVVDSNISTFIANSLFASTAYKLGAGYKKPHITQLIVAPFPKTTSYMPQMSFTDFTNINGATKLNLNLATFAQLDARNSIQGNDIVDGVKFFETQKFTNKRADVNSTAFIIASSDAGVAAAVDAVKTLKATSTVVTIAIGTGAKMLNTLATDGYAYTIEDLSNATQVAVVTDAVSNKLSLESDYCMPTTTTAVATTTESTTTSVTTTTSIPRTTTTYHCPIGILEDIAVIYAQSSSNRKQSNAIAAFLESTLFASSDYQTLDINGNVITQFLAAPYPQLNAGSSAYGYPGVNRNPKSAFLEYIKTLNTMYGMIPKSVKGTDISGALTFVKNATADPSHRKTGNSTLILIGDVASDATQAEAIVAHLKKSGTRVIVIATTADSVFTKWASTGESNSLVIANLTDATALTTVAQNISSSLAAESGVCVPVPGPTIPTTATAAPTTQPTTTSVSTTTSIPTTTTTYHCPTGILQDIAVVYAQSSSDKNQSNAIAAFLESTLFASSDYQTLDINGNVITQFLAAPYPQLNAGSSAYDYPGINRNPKSAFLKFINDKNTMYGMAPGSVKGTDISGALTFVKIANAGPSHRKNDNSTIILVGDIASDAMQAEVIVENLKKSGSRVIVIATTADSVFTKWASKGASNSFVIADLTDTTALTSVAHTISSSLAAESGVCVPLSHHD